MAVNAMIGLLLYCSFSYIYQTFHWTEWSEVTQRSFSIIWIGILIFKDTMDENSLK